MEFTPPAMLIFSVFSPKMLAGWTSRTSTSRCMDQPKKLPAFLSMVVSGSFSRW